MRWHSLRKWEMLWGCHARWDPSSATYPRPSPSFPFYRTVPNLMWLNIIVVQLCLKLFEVVGSCSFMLATRVAYSDSFTYVHKLVRMYPSHNTQQWGYSNFKIDTASRENRRVRRIWCNEIGFINVATSVAYSDSFTNCHECQSYLYLITIDDRHMIVQIYIK